MAVSYSIEEGVVATRLGRIAYLEAGQGPVLLLLHGIGSNATSWRAQLLGLSHMRRVIAWNAPGYGASAPLPANAPTAMDYAEAIACFLEARDVSCCDMVGHSLGALMAARFARSFPGALSSLTLASCAIGHARYEASERERLLAARLGDVDELGMRAMAHKRGPRLLSAGASEEARRQVVETMASLNAQGYAQAARMLSQGDMIEDLKHLPRNLPVQFIYGDEDIITPPAVNLQAAAAIPRAPVHVIEGAGHALYIERAADFNALLLLFMGAAHDE